MTDPRPEPGPDGPSQVPPQGRVALVRGPDRYRNILQALESIAGDIDLSNRQRVLIKPNFVVTHKPLASTYGVELRDLNHDLQAPVTVYDWRLRPLRLHLARTVLDSDFRISIVGNASLADCIRPFRSHDSYRRQQRWHLPGAERYLPRLDGRPEPSKEPELRGRESL